jgi:hypothetical protein
MSAKISTRGWLLWRRPGAVAAKRSWQILVCVTSTSLALHDSNAQNLVTNPGFENGTTGWYGGQLTATSITPHTGSACGSATANAYGTACGQDMLGKLQPGQTYTWSTWLRVASGSPSVTMRLDQTDSAGSRGTILATKTVATAWALYSTTFSLSVTGALTNLSINFVAGNAPLTLFLDDASLTNFSPVIGLEPTNHLALLSWPTTATNYTLQAATNLLAPITWTTVTNAVQSNASIFWLTLPATNAARFFRLQHP